MTLKRMSNHVENTVKKLGDRTIFDCLSICASAVL
jgi:hypothetical protein